MTNEIVTASGKLALTAQERDTMQSMLDAHDRAGFYMTYHAMTGSDEAALQASIATFSDSAGGVALAANRIVQTWIGPGTANPIYPGMYAQSQNVAQSALDAIKSKLDENGGLIDDNEFLASATKAWVDAGVVEYFPGNFLFNQTDILFFAARLRFYLDGNGPDPFGSFIADMRSNYDQGSLASMLALLTLPMFAKEAADFGGGTSSAVAAGGYTLMVDGSGHTEAVFGLDAEDALAATASGALIGAIGDGQVIADFRNYLKELIWPSAAGPIDRTHLNEFYTTGFNGDTQSPIPVGQPQADRAVWRPAATSGSEILSLESSGSVSGGGGHDLIFGSESGIFAEGADTLSGDAGNDIVWGKSGIDHLDGGLGDDTLRGGEGDDTIVGGAGNDLLDGGDINIAADQDGLDAADYQASIVSGVTVEVGVADPNDLAKHIVRVTNDGDGDADVLHSIEKIVLGDADDTATIDKRAGGLEMQIDFGTGNNTVTVIDGSATPVTVPADGGLRLNFSTLREDGSNALLTKQTLNLTATPDPNKALGGVLLVDGKQLVGGAAFDFDTFDLSGGTRSVMVGILDVPSRPPYTVDYGTTGISTTDRVQEWLAAHVTAYQNYIAGLVGTGPFGTLVAAPFMSILTADLVRLKSSFSDLYHQEILGTQGERYVLTNKTYAAGKLAGADLKIEMNRGSAAAYTIEVDDWKQGDLGIRIDTLDWRHGLDSGLNKNGQQDDWTSMSPEAIREKLATLGFEPMDNAGIGGGNGGAGLRAANVPGIARTGGAGADTLAGTAGDDNLYGAKGADTLKGGAGRDAYVFAAGDGADVIDDLSVEGSVVRFLGGLDPATMSKVLVTGTGGLQDLLITYGAGDTVRILGWSSLSAEQQALWTFEGVSTAYAGTNTQTRDTSQIPPEEGGAGRRYFDGTSGADTLSGTELSQIFDGYGGDDAIDAGGGDDTIYGGSGNDRLAGGAGNDTIYGDSGVDAFDGGKGDDTIRGGAGSSYVFRKGDGHDVWNLGESALIRLVGIQPGDVVLERDGSQGDGFRLKVVSSGDTVDLVSGGGVSYGYPLIEKLSFDDGTEWSYADIKAMYFAKSGTAGNDLIVGFDASDRFKAGAGDDEVYGGGGRNAHVWNRGDGNDTIHSGDSIAPYDAMEEIVLGAGITAADLQFSRPSNSDDLLVAITGTGAGSIRLAGYLYDEQYGDGSAFDTRIQFADGSYLTRQSIDDRYRMTLGNPVSGVVRGTSRGETLQGGAGNDTISGSAGADTLLGGAGDDVLQGGAGEDILEGGAGNDRLDGETLRFGAGFGSDVTVDSSSVVRAEFAGMELADFSFRLAIDERQKSYTDLVMTLRAGGDALAVTHAYSTSNFEPDGLAARRVNAFAFSDGTVYDGHGYLRGSGSSYSAESGLTLFKAIARAAEATANPIAGTAAGETLAGTVTNDGIFGEAGADTVNAGAGHDFVNAGDGDDLVNGDIGNDTVLGGRGIDTVNAGDGADLAFGGSGNDALRGNAGDDRLFGEGGDDTLEGGTGADLLFGQSGSDTYVFNRGDGEDILVASDNRAAGDVETLMLGGGIGFGELLFGYSHESTSESDYIDLVITFANGPGDKITVRDFLGTGSLTQLRIGATTWSLSQLMETITGATSGNDTVGRTGLGNLVYGGRGNDTLNGSNASEVFFFNAGDGQDVIVGASGSYSDKLLFGGTIRPQDAILSRQANGDLLITFASGTDSITVKSQFTDDWEGISSIAFTDGTVWYRDKIVQLAAVRAATAGPDTILGHSGKDTLGGGKGDDLVKGGAGDDTYLYDLGDGRDTIEDESGIDALVLGAGIEPAAVTVTRSAGNANDALLTLSGTDSILLKDSLAAGGVNTVVFANGAVWTRADLANLAMASLKTAGNDTIAGTVENDTINGGAGNDALAGGEGSDTYFFDAGSGVDTITEGADPYGTDAVSFGAGVAATAVSVRRGTVNTNDLVIDAGDGNTITVSNHFAGSTTGIEQIVFASGEIWSRNVITRKTLVAQQTGGADTINGSALPDRITGGAGNDMLNGGAGADTYVFSRGDGADTIADTGTETGADRIEFGAGIAAADVDLFRSGTNDLTIALRGSGDKMVVKDHFLAGAAKIGLIKFADGSLWNADKIADAALNAAPAASTALTDKAATQGQAFGFAVPAAAFTDADADALALSATLGNGSALPAWLRFDGTSFSGTPQNGDVGTIQVKVTAKDADGDAASQTFNIAVGNVNDAPAATTLIANKTATAGAAFSFTLPGGLFVDPDNGLPGVPAQTIAVTAKLGSGQALPSWLSFNSSTLTFSGTPAAGNAGPLDIVLTASDGSLSGTTRFGIFVGSANTAPAAGTAIAAQAATEDAPFSFQIPASAFSDANAGDRLRYTATKADGSALPAWLTLDPVTGLFSGMPLNGDVGALSVRVTARDIFGASGTSTFTVNVGNTNDAPVKSADLLSVQTLEDQLFNYTIPAGAFSDVDPGDTLTYSATLSDGSALPAWLAFNAGTRTFSGTPQGADAGILAITVTARDGAGATAKGEFFVVATPVNDAPVAAAALAPATVIVDLDHGVDAKIPLGAFTDEDSIGLDYTATLANGDPLPSWLYFDRETRSFYGTPGEAALGEDAYTKVYQVKVTATDGKGAAASSAFNLTLNAPVIDGTEYGNSLTGTRGPDKINGKEGGDRLFGAEGTDTYIFEGQFGQDSIDNQSTYQGQTTYSVGDVIRFGTGIAPQDVTVSLNGGFLANSYDPTILTPGLGRDDVVLAVGGNSVTIDGQLSIGVDRGQATVKEVRFADGTVWTSAQLAARFQVATAGNDVMEGDFTANTLSGGQGNDRLYGSYGNDVLDGGTGNDDLYGSSGDDTYLFGRGSGQDRILDATDYNQKKGFDTLRFGAGVAVSDLVFTRDYRNPYGYGLDPLVGNLLIGISGTSDTIRISRQSEIGDGNSAGIDRFEFADGTVLTRQQMDALVNPGGLITGTDAAEEITGTSQNDRIVAKGGDDTLLGMEGNDTYVWNLGDGNDAVVDADVSSVDVVEFGPGILPSDIRLSRKSTDPYQAPLFQYNDHGVSPDLFIDVVSTGARIRVVNGYEYNDSAKKFWMPINVVRFSNGTVWDVDQMRASFLQATAGSDTQIGFSRTNDMLDGGAGNDELRGLSGADTYVFGRGYGVDTVIDAKDTTGDIFSGTSTPVDVVKFLAGIQLGDLQLRREFVSYKFDYAVNAVAAPSAMFILKIAGTGDELRLWGSVDYITKFQFTDTGSFTTIATLKDMYFAQASTSGDDTVIGFGDGRVISTGAGNDTIGLFYSDEGRGGTGNDTYVVAGSGTIVELAGEGTDTVQSSESYALGATLENLTLTGLYAISGTGNALSNIIRGNDAANILDGQTGADTLIGGGGDDTYVTDGGDTITEAAGGGVDTVQSSATHALAAELENLTLTGATAINGTGNVGNNVITGTSAGNVLDGGGGTDTLKGGAGSDTYVTDGGDTIVENANAGTDTVQSSVSYVLATNLENLVLTGAAAIDGTGNSVDNTITGNLAANLLSGGTGNDTLIGGGGDDIFVVNGGDTVTEAAGAGTDSVQSSVTLTLAVNVENLLLTGTSAIGGTGNTLANAITGNSGNNMLTGADGNDTLNGGTGTDTLVGGLGDDTFVTDGGDTVTEAASAGTDTVQSSATHTLAVNVENLLLTGIAASNGTGNTLANTITGNASNNTLTGADGNDVLDGGGGTDTLVGGLGNDVFVTDGGDTITEAASAGTDTVQSSVAYVLGADLENLVLLGAVAINGTGNALANNITGNGAANVLTGGAGNDVIDGGLGSDTAAYAGAYSSYTISNGGLTVSSTAEGADTLAGIELATFSDGSYNFATGVFTSSNLGVTINGTTGADTISPTAAPTGQPKATTGNDTIYGLAGNDSIDGGGGADRMYGGAGNDAYVVDNAGDQAIEANPGTGADEGGTDGVSSSVTYTLGAFVENLTLTGTAAVNGTGNALSNAITGNSGNNTLTGADGNDTLDGGTGTDTLVGGLGNDVYVTDSGDTITEAAGAGTDTVQSSVAYTLGADLENLTLTGTAAVNGTGNSLANTIVGNAGANVLDGGAGADAMTGGAGNDTYVVDNAADATVEAASGGTDLVQTALSWTLAAEVDNLTLTGTAAVNGTGNALANQLAGNTGANLLNGAAGNDRLTGGLGADNFLFDSALNATTNVDQITDFSVPDDTIRLENAIFTALATTGTLAASAFAANTTGAATTTGHRIIYETDTGKLFYDSNGSASGGAVQFATLATSLALTNADFIVV